MYRITIERVTREPKVQRTWQKVADSGNPKDGGVVYDYAEYPGEEINRVEVLKQELEEVDLKVVIRALNGL